jgi:probable F420-dependent oxidoreductase
MKWGIVFSNTGFPDPEYAAAFAQAAEEAGFESLWSGEHVVMPRGPSATPYRGSADGSWDRLGRRGGMPDPLVWFAYVAGSTSRIRFGTGVLILPEHQPAVLAKTAATLDHMSGGRLMLGIGVGEIPEEYEAVGMEFTNRGRRMDEYIDAMRTLWQQDEASFEGEYVRFDHVECRPWPVRRTIPLFIGGSSDAAIRRAALRGDGYFPFVFPGEDPGRDPDAMEFTAGSTRSVEESKMYAGLGIHRLTLAVRGHTMAEVREDIARLGDELVLPTVDL